MRLNWGTTTSPAPGPAVATARDLSSPLCAQVAGDARGSRESKATAARTPAPQTTACPSHALSSQHSTSWRNAPKWELLWGLGFQVGLRGNTDHSNSLSSFQLPFQSSEYLKTEGLGAPVMLARKHPLTPAALPWPRRQPQRLKSLWQATYGGRIYQLCFAFIVYTVVLPLLPSYDK